LPFAFEPHGLPNRKFKKSKIENPMMSRHRPHGFLGAGKTTLLNRILTEQPRKKTRRD